MHELWSKNPAENVGRLFHVINITLNVVSTKRLAWQERKAEPFTVSPLHCGTAYLGYRSSKTYGDGPNKDGTPAQNNDGTSAQNKDGNPAPPDKDGASGHETAGQDKQAGVHTQGVVQQQPEQKDDQTQGNAKTQKEAGAERKFGIALGTAMAISGAAVSPNMGYNSSPSITLLLTLFNVRLGWWLGNPGKAGDEFYQTEGPKMGLRDRSSMKRSGKPPMKGPTCICRTAATSKISGCTRWCGGAADSSLSSTPAAIPISPSRISAMRCEKFISILVCGSHSKVLNKFRNRPSDEDDHQSVR